MKKAIAVLISGRGSNLEALLEASLAKDFPAQVACVISNNIKAKGLEIARKYNIPSFTTSPDITRAEMEKQINNFLVKYNNNNNINDDNNNLNLVKPKDNIEFICLAGFMKVLSSDFINCWPRRIINIHPSLLPAFKGLNAQKQALEAGVKITGCTVHFVTSELDSGEIIMQKAVPVLPEDTLETLSQRILEAEHQCLPLAIKELLLKNEAL